MKLKELFNLGFVMTHPLECIGDPDVIGYERNIKGFSLLVNSMDDDFEWTGGRIDGEMDVCVTIYENDEQISFDNIIDLSMFISLMEKLKTRMEVMGE